MGISLAVIGLTPAASLACRQQFSLPLLCLRGKAATHVNYLLCFLPTRSHHIFTLAI
jgi:hypothetical protein